MYMHKTKLMLALTLFFVLNGCSTISGTPKSPLEYSDSDPNSNSHDTEAVINLYSKEFAAKALQIATNQSNTDPSKIEIDKSERNKLISMALTIMDVRYAEFINSTESWRKNKEMLTDIVELSMNLAGTAVGGAGTKTILAAISAGVNGINGSIDTNYFYEKTFQSLVAQMNADRKDVLVSITKGKQCSIEEYQWSDAVHDLVDYYNAGTLLGAISSIQKDAGKKEGNAESIIKEILEIPENALVPPDVVAQKRRIKLALKKITSENLATINDMMKKLSEDLKLLPDCQSLSIAPPGPEAAKKSINACIVAAGQVGRDSKLISMDLTKIEVLFTQVGILP
jgi:hypothetical protein